VYIHSFQLDSSSLNPKPLLHVTLELFLKTPFSIAVGGSFVIVQAIVAAPFCAQTPYVFSTYPTR
jgi:hypothetical protein